MIFLFLFLWVIVKDPPKKISGGRFQIKKKKEKEKEKRNNKKQQETKNKKIKK